MATTLGKTPAALSAAKIFGKSEDKTAVLKLNPARVWYDEKNGDVHLIIPQRMPLSAFKDAKVSEKTGQSNSIYTNISVPVFDIVIEHEFTNEKGETESLERTMQTKPTGLNVFVSTR